MHGRLRKLGGGRGRLVLAIAVLGAALGLGAPLGAPALDAADRYVAGGAVVERSPVAADRADAVRAMARSFGARLGLPPAAALRVERVTDRFAGATYDEVTGTDGLGQAIHLQRLDDRGRLVGAVVFGWQSNGGRALANARAAANRGSRLAAQLELDTSGDPDVQAVPDGDGWTLGWQRFVDGVPVVGDGVRIDLWPDGRVHAVVRTERALATRPATILDAAAARGSAEATLKNQFGDRAGEIAVSSVALGWVAPNGTFDPTAPDAPGATLRLAWVAEAQSSGDLADGLRAVKLFLDAGTGDLIGGDVLQ